MSHLLLRSVNPLRCLTPAFYVEIIFARYSQKPSQLSFPALVVFSQIRTFRQAETTRTCTDCAPGHLYSAWGTETMVTRLRVSHGISLTRTKIICEKDPAPSSICERFTDVHIISVVYPVKFILVHVTYNLVVYRYNTYRHSWALTD
jgi:hypothetical protein